MSDSQIQDRKAHNVSGNGIWWLYCWYLSQRETLNPYPLRKASHLFFKLRMSKIKSYIRRHDEVMLLQLTCLCFYFRLYLPSSIVSVRSCHCRWGVLSIEDRLTNHSASWPFKCSFKCFLLCSSLNTQTAAPLITLPWAALVRHVNPERLASRSVRPSHTDITSSDNNKKGNERTGKWQLRSDRSSGLNGFTAARNSFCSQGGALPTPHTCCGFIYNWGQPFSNQIVVR